MSELKGLLITVGLSILAGIIIGVLAPSAWWAGVICFGCLCLPAIALYVYDNGYDDEYHP